MATEFTCTINKTNAAEEDYSSLSSWESALDEADLTSVLTRVYNVTSVTGTVSDGANVDGQTNGYTAKVLHVNSSYTSPRRVMVVHDAGDEEFVNDEVLQVDGENYITLTSSCESDTVKPVCEAYKGGGVLGGVTVDFGGVNATNFYRLTVAAASRHTGIEGTGCIVKPAAWDTGIRCRDAYSIVEWFEVDGSTADAMRAIYMELGNSIIRNCIVYDCVYQLAVALVSDPAWVIRTICYNCAGVAFSMGADYQSNYAWNCTAYNNVVDGFENGGANASSIIQNCISIDNGTDYDAKGGSFDGSSDKNIDGDGSAPGTTTYTSTGAEEFESVTGGSENFHINGGANCDALDHGDDLGTTNGVNIDIDGVDAEGDTWDIGADEYVAAGVAYRQRIIGIF